MLKQDGKDPLQAAMEEAAGFDALKFSSIDWRTLHNNLSFDISITRAANEVDDRKLQLKRDERRDRIRRTITGQSMQMVAHYAKQVNQKTLAASAILKLERAMNTGLQNRLQNTRRESG